MAATLYTGNGSTQSISNAVNTVSFQPDFVWVKGRNEAFYHRLTSSLQSLPNYLSSNSTDAEGSVNGTISAITSTGFSVNINGGTGGTNSTGINYVGWTWKAGGTAVSNTAGTITSSVSANTTAGFSVVTYTGNGIAATVGHGLGVAPSMVIVKRRNSTGNWPVQHTSVSASNVLFLDLTNAQTASTTFQQIYPTASIFYIDGGNANVGANGGTYVAYCWAPVAGYSAFGAYTGNGSADGPFIYTGFRPRWVMFKRTDATQNWQIFDTARDIANPEVNSLFANLANAESNGYAIDYLSNGFKPRLSDAGYNASGGTYIYAAFAESAFKFSNAR